MAKSWIVIADSARVRVFENDSHIQKFTEIAGLEHPESRAHGRDLTSDREGRAFDTAGRGRHEMSTHQSPHEHEAELFARRVAKWLSKSYAVGEFAHLKLSAPPAFLGILRKSLTDDIRAVLGTVITKNLVHDTEDSIARHFEIRRGSKDRSIQ